MVKLLQRRREGLVKEELEWVPVGAGNAKDRNDGKAGRRNQFAYCIEGELIGILNLGHKEDKTIYLTNEAWSFPTMLTPGRNRNREAGSTKI